jgi:hypothetical protein
MSLVDAWDQPSATGIDDPRVRALQVENFVIRTDRIDAASLYRAGGCFGLRKVGREELCVKDDKICTRTRLSVP